MEYKFICPVSMEVTEEQFKRDLKKQLSELGYEVDHIHDNYYSKAYPLMYLNVYNNANKVGYCMVNSSAQNATYFIGHYNPQLSLALAAMTDKKDGINGEWWKCIKGSNNFTVNKLYKQTTESISISISFRDDSNRPNGFTHNQEHFAKPTKQDIINNFTGNGNEIVVVKSDYQDFFNFMNQEHDLILTETQIDEILRESEKHKRLQIKSKIVRLEEHKLSIEEEIKNLKDYLSQKRNY